jgi:hypothetical protein
VAKARRIAVAIAALAAVATAGCGLGPGESSEGEATLNVTRDYGSVPVAEATLSDPSESETVMRMLDAEAEISTRFGGGFVHSIEGVSGRIDDGRSFDWFFYVNGLESGRGAAEVGVSGGDRIWWDYRDWTDAMRVPAVVGSWPQPFSGEDGPVTVECAGAPDPCDAVVGRLEEEGVGEVVEGAEPGGEAGARIVVGRWARIADDPVAGMLDDGPATSGVFARFEGAGEALVLLDERGDAARRLRRDAGLVAALRRGEDPPTWLVTGTDAGGVAAAAATLDAEDLRDRYAVATAGAAALPLPVEAE